MEPYSKASGEQSNAPSGGGGRGGGGSGGGGSSKNWNDMSVEEKVKKCCKEFNSDKGCSKPKCRYKHWCTHVDQVKKRVCWGRDHNLKGHK